MAANLDPDQLSRLNILRQVPLESVSGLLERCEIRRLAAGDTLIAAGAANQVMYLILSGKLAVHLEPPPAEPVAHLQTGQTVGELSVIDERPASAWVIASEPAELIAVDEDTFWSLIGSSHEFAVNLLLLLASRMRANNSVLTESAKLRRKFERDAVVDGLTGLHNRRWFDQKLPRLVRRHLVGGSPMSLLVLDVDHFKSFNDRFGHAAGDAVLRAVAGAVIGGLRPTDVAARYGGEELVVVLPETPLSGALVAAERVRQLVSRLTVTAPDGAALPAVTISIGAASLDETGDAAALFQRADAALYRAKSAGRNRVEAAETE